MAPVGTTSFTIHYLESLLKRRTEMTEEKKTNVNAEEVKDTAAVEKSAAAEPKASPEKKEEVKSEKTEEKTEAKAPTEKKEEAKPKVKVTEKMESMMNTIGEMSVMELSDLVKALEEKFGVSAQAPVAVAASGGAAGAAGAAEEEKSVFTVMLVEIGPKKINVIKEVRALTNLGLKEAKDLVEAAPKEVKEGLTKEEAEKMKKQLETAGAKIELK